MCDNNTIDNVLLIVGTTTKKKKTVTFHKIEIIELAYTIGDNPSVSYGVPLSLEWVAQKRTVLAVDFFETYRPTRCATWCQLRLGGTSRINILLESGYTQLEIDAAANEAMKIRRFGRVSRRQHFYSRYGDDESGEEERANKHPKKSSAMEDPRPFPPHSKDAFLRTVVFEPVVARSA
jgi:hypothetical protein